MSADEKQKEQSSITYSRLYRYYVLHDLENFHIFLAALSGVFFLYSKFGRKPVFSDIAFWLFYFTILSFVIHLNQRKLYFFMSSNSSVSYLPVNDIRRINNFFLAVFIAASGIVMYVLPTSAFHRFVSFIGKLLKALIGALLHLIFRDTKYSGLGEILKPNINYEQVDPSASSDSILDAIIRIFQKIMTNVAVILIVVLALLIIVWAYRNLMARRSHSSSLDEHEFVATGMKRTRLERSSRRSGFHLTGSDVNTKIRKYYYKQIQKQLSSKFKKDKAVTRSAFSLHCLTPKEIEQFVRLPEDSRTQQLHSTYEKARYSSAECSYEDLANIKK